MFLQLSLFVGVRTITLPIKRFTMLKKLFERFFNKTVKVVSPPRQHTWKKQHGGGWASIYRCEKCGKIAAYDSAEFEDGWVVRVDGKTVATSETLQDATKNVACV